MTFPDARRHHCFPAKCRLWNEGRNSTLMTHHYPDLGRASDWLKQISNVARPIRSSTQIWQVIRHQCGISVLFYLTSFLGQPSGAWCFEMSAVFLGYSEASVTPSKGTCYYLPCCVFAWICLLNFFHQVSADPIA